MNCDIRVRRLPAGAWQKRVPLPPGSAHGRSHSRSPTPVSVGRDRNEAARMLSPVDGWRLASGEPRRYFRLWCRPCQTESDALSSSASMAARVGSGRLGHAAMRRARSRSGGPLLPLLLTAAHCWVHNAEVLIIRVLMRVVHRPPEPKYRTWPGYSPRVLHPSKSQCFPPTGLDGGSSSPK